MNAIQFKEGLKVSKFRRSLSTYNDWELDINGKTYYLYNHGLNTWSAYCETAKEFYAYNTTRKEVVADILSGLYFEYKQINS
tara:strand:+ start:201 stop:446 length:246 start_codon:yes stop_codon:yes gene_type:complete